MICQSSLYGAEEQWGIIIEKYIYSIVNTEDINCILQEKKRHAYNLEKAGLLQQVVNTERRAGCPFNV